VRKKLILAGVLLLVAVWGFRQIVPAGLRLRSVEPFFFWSHDLGTFPSPASSREVRIVVNDAGAMHSGNHWVWVVAYSPLWGKRIFAEGYVEHDETSVESLRLRWLSENEIAVTFRQGRHSAVSVTRTFSLP
jgi:hypothetical protein